MVPKSDVAGKTALITGITGQDGSYLAELLLSKGYRVYGLIRRHSVPIYPNITHLFDRITVVDADIADYGSLVSAIDMCKPDEVYHLAAQSFVGISFVQPMYTGDITGLGVTRLLEAVRMVRPSCRVYNASTSELFGGCTIEPLDEDVPPCPISPYAAAKLYGYWMGKTYRQAYGMFVANGILFNHESPRRGPEFVTRRISLGVARIKLGLANKLCLGNLDAQRDWGYAPEYVEAMWRMLQMDQPGDFVIATGSKHSVRVFLSLAFKAAGIDDYSEFVDVDSRLMRPSDVPSLRGDPRKARAKLNWEAKVTFPELVRLMVEADIELLSSSGGRDCLPCLR